MRIFILSAVLCLIVPLSLFSQETSTLELKDTMWQFLPDDVISVVAGNDGRLWLQIQDDPEEEDIGKIKQNIQEEFLKKSPRILDCRPVLFEPGKRVWFTNNKNNLILGYDGEKWIEKKLEEPLEIYAGCPFNRRQRNNLFLDGRAFFIISIGILSFDGENWDYFSFLGNYNANAVAIPLVATAAEAGKEVGNCNPRAAIAAAPVSDPPILLPCSDMKGVIAYINIILKLNSSTNTKAEASLYKCMEFRDGKWTKLEFDGIKPDDIEIIMPRKEGMILGMLDGKMILYKDESSNKEKFDDLLSKLSDDNFNVREKTTKELADLGMSFKKAVLKALKEAKDPEVRTRLSKAIELMKENLEVYLNQENSPVFGDYMLKDPVIVHYDSQARIFLACTDVRMKENNESLGPGLIILDDENKASFLKGKNFTEGWDKHYFFGDLGYIQPLPSIFWLQADNKIRILDIDKKDFIAESKDISFNWLQYAGSDGTFFCSRRRPCYSEDAPGIERPIAIFKPSAKDERRMLAGQEIKILDEDFVVIEEGSAWFKNPEGKVMMFDGYESKNIPELKNLKPECNIISGKDGAIICKGQPLSFMYAEKNIFIAESLDRLIMENRKLIEMYFGDKNRDLIHDDAGNIWFKNDTSTLSINNNNQTFDLSSKIVEFFSTEKIRRFALAGAGKNKVLIDYYSYGWENGHSADNITLSCELNNKKFIFKKIPRMTWLPSFNPIYDSSGSLWYPAYTDSRKYQIACRMTADEKPQEIKDSGLPYLCDMSGNIWLGNIIKQPKNKFNIWKNGEIKGHVVVPHANESTTLISDREGSVIAITSPLVTHLTAENPEKPSEYKVKTEYWLDVKGKSTPVKGFKIRNKFYLAVTSSSSNSKDHYLNIIEFPPSEGK